MCACVRFRMFPPTPYPPPAHLIHCLNLQESLLQAKLTRMAIMIGYAGSVVAVATVLVLFLRYFILVRLH